MLVFIGVVLRVLIGFLAASLVAGAVQVLFALTPAELLSAPSSYWSDGALLLLGTTTVSAMFAAPFLLISAFFSELQGIRSFAYHALIGIAIAISGHALLYSGQTINEPSIVNSYALAAYLTTGFAAGITYWLVAGRLAYGKRLPRAAPAAKTTRKKTADEPASAKA
ncbi:MAG TPA: hypothetical protein VMX97_03535 [Hyphomicrobiaceae bacterium]|nr:hypothetical protein [Hyphomicrobiaceae bacterium]